LVTGYWADGKSILWISPSEGESEMKSTCPVSSDLAFVTGQSSLTGTKSFASLSLIGSCSGNEAVRFVSSAVWKGREEPVLLEA
jgi:hypothetical protein